MAEIEYFYGVNSAFAYLGAERLISLSQDSRRRIVHRPVKLGEVVRAVHPKGFAGRSPAHYSYYFGREIERWAEFRNAPVRGGIPDNHGNDTTLASCMVIAADMRGDNVDQLALRFLQAHWRDHADLADQDTLGALVNAAGMDADDLIEAAGTPGVLAVLEANTAEAIERSVFGSPTYVVDGDMFYGQDRLEMVERAIARPFARVWS